MFAHYDPINRLTNNQLHGQAKDPWDLTPWANDPQGGLGGDHADRDSDTSWHPEAMPLQQVPLHRHPPCFIRRPVEGRLQ